MQNDVSSALSVFKAGVRAMDAYHLRERSYKIKLNQNESPFDLPPALKQEILEACAQLSWNRYPSFGNRRLVEKLSKHLDVRPAQVLVGNGSNELLQTLAAAVLEPGKRVLLVTPTFMIYQQLVRVSGAELVEIDFAEDWSFPVDRILEVLHAEPVDLCILCSPNSPTGVALPRTGLESILEAATGLVLADEAYYEFCGQTALPLLQRFPNLLITRTFSKAMGLAGLRTGYVVGREEVTAELNKAKLPYNLDLLSETIACAMLENAPLVRRNVDLILSEKERLVRELSRFRSVEVTPSSTNFLMMRSELSAPALFEQLLAAGILVRDISGYHPRLQNTLRVSVGKPEENDAFLSVLADIF